MNKLIEVITGLGKFALSVTYFGVIPAFWLPKDSWLTVLYYGLPLPLLFLYCWYGSGSLKLTKR